MTESSFIALLVAYAAATAGWWVVHTFRPGLWPASPEARFDRPWRAFGVAVLVSALTPLVGQLYVRGYLLPEHGAAGPLFASLDQVLIFSPVLLVAGLREPGRNGIWLGGGRALERVGTGVLLAAFALLVWGFVRAGDHGFLASLARIPRYDNLDEFTQVLLEDITIAFLFIRLSAAAGPRAAIAVVAVLFAAGHIPTLVTEGAPFSEIAALAGDVVLGVVVLSTMRHSRDILWFWPIHAVLDLSQFTRITGI